MASDILLNFLPLIGPTPMMRVFRRPCSPDAKADHAAGLYRFTLPVESTAASTASSSGTDRPRANFHVAFDRREGFEDVTLSAEANRQLFLRFLYHWLIANCHEHAGPDEFETEERDFRRTVAFTMASFREGRQQVVLEPYFLGAVEQYGFLVDFHFRRNPGDWNVRRIQQLSLSLNAEWKRNRNRYVDRWRQVTDWVRRIHPHIFPLPLPGNAQPVGVETQFVRLPRLQARPKVYIVGGGREERQTYRGVEARGPLARAKATELVFMFREREREAARRLARALTGRSQPAMRFRGYEEMFQSGLTLSSEPILLRDYSRASMTEAVREVRTRGEAVLPVLVMPRDERAYEVHKAVFTEARIATQVCTTNMIDFGGQLEWSVANVALQIFCKAGGEPWQVKPDRDRTLIVGISQAHEAEGEGDSRVIRRYVAFSVLTDSSGRFRRTAPLGTGTDMESYVRDLTNKLTELLAVEQSAFDDVVVHTTFRLGLDEMRAIEGCVQAASTSDGAPRFAVVKVNDHHHRFFAVDPASNTMVPPEGAYVRLGHGEYLAWFEGATPTAASGAPSGPAHLYLPTLESHQVMPRAELDARDAALIQDLSNLSGANWRGFNARSVPVSVWYCHLIADHLRDMREAGLPLPNVEHMHPWFL